MGPRSTLPGHAIACRLDGDLAFSVILRQVISVDPLRLARRQLQIDRERTARFSDLLAHKIGRMVASPLAFLRGSAPLFYGLIDRHERLSEGPAGVGWLVGDAHLENFGAYRADSRVVDRSREEDDRIVFDVNDFDEAFVGPWRFDVVRLLTSIVLGGREMGADGPRTLDLCDRLIDAYVGAVFHSQKAPPPARPVTSLVDQVRLRTRNQLLDARTSVVNGQRRFIRGPRYQELSPKLRTRAERAFAKYAKRIPDAQRPPDEALVVIDAAFRVAGTGSLGCLRVAVLVRGKGGRDGAWVFDMKQEDSPSAACLVRPPHLEPAERVCAAIRACVAYPPRMIGFTRLRGSSMFARRLSPQEDKIDFVTLRPEDLAPLAAYLGARLGEAHRRGAKRMPYRPWSTADRGRILANAISLAGIHEATYLAYCEIVRR
ncbi:MAG: DUF2252 domain-containing protein [Myxococcota bacterium]|nr:DUF2252 domain-containing protein [Myxococcota bacterium]